jgi:hypothetical protein
MHRIPAALSVALVACTSALAPTPAAAAALGIKSGRVTNLADRNIAFKEPVQACLKLCTKVVVERQTFECSPYFITPTEGCDLPWIDTYYPNPDYFGQGYQCIPPEPELGGYLLDERVERVERVSKQTADCKSVVTETTLQVLPDRHNPPRPCPDPGPWASENEKILSIQFISCQ